MIPPNSISWNLTGDREMQLIYAANRSVASQVQYLVSPPPPTEPMRTRRRRGRPTIYTKELLARARATYICHCRAIGDLVTIEGLIAFSGISKRTWERYLAACRRLP
jgi:hypothetical protein